MGLAVASVGLFLASGHLAATSLIRAQQSKQLEELSRVALRRSEATVDYGVETLEELAAGGPIDCSPSTLQSVRLHVYQRGAVKDIRVVDRSGAVKCSAYSETLEFDQGWATRDDMRPAADPAVRLFRVDQFFGVALGVMRDVDRETGLVAILGITGSLFDIMPPELQNDSNVALQLTDGRPIAQFAQSPPEASDQDVVSLAATSDRYPIRTTVSVKRSALAHWNQEPYLQFMAAAGLLGIVFGLLVMRVAAKPSGPLQDLDRAIAAGEFRPFLQPIFDLDKNTIIGAEVLARWVKPDGTVIPPSRFIELAEEAGRINTITWQLLSVALAELQSLFRSDRTFKLSMNISPRHFVAPGFVADLRKVVSESGVANRQVTLELTERQSFDDLSIAARLVKDVRGLGFRVAIDDVGIGHSGLSQIQSLGADVLKIDKFFVDCIDRDGSAAIVVELLVRMAREMLMTVVAEGIETIEQVRALTACGVHCGQGFLLAKPMPVPAFLSLVGAARHSATVEPADAVAA